MVVMAKPHRNPDELKKKIIEKGGSVKIDKPDSNWMTISLRIRNDILLEIANRLACRVGISRNAWILEALQEKLNREA